MAQETVKKQNENKKNKKNNKGMAGFFIWMLLFLLSAGIVAAVRLNWLGISTKYLEKPLRNIPVIKYILPPNKENDPYVNVNKSQLMRQIESKNKELEDLKGQLELTSKQLKSAQDEASRLQEIEKQTTEFEKDKKVFDEAVAKQDPNGFKEFYEKINPDSAKQIYEQTQESERKQAVIRKSANTYAVMEPQNAASIMTEMLKKDTNLVVEMLKSMKEQDVSDILAAMDPIDAAKLTKLVSSGE